MRRTERRGPEKSQERRQVPFPILPPLLGIPIPPTLLPHSPRPLYSRLRHRGHPASRSTVSPSQRQSWKKKRTTKMHCLLRALWQAEVYLLSVEAQAQFFSSLQNQQPTPRHQQRKRPVLSLLRRRRIDRLFRFQQPKPRLRLQQRLRLTLLWMTTTMMILQTRPLLCL